MTLLAFVELLAGSIWAGGLVAIGVAARTARSELAPAQQVQFFRTLGRSYLRIGGTALVIALACGFALLERGSWNTEKTAAIAVGTTLALVTSAGILQARALTRLNSSLIAAGDHTQRARVARQSRRTGVLRGCIAALTLAELALVALMIG